ncbi:MAG: MFS transporter, partial [Alphaproteobacteria bacterium]
LGPSLGGMVIDAFDWRAIFLAPIPACFLAVLLGFLFLPPESHRSEAGKFDVLGFGLINATVFCWFTMLGNGQRWGWQSDDILMLGAATLICGVAFVASQKRPGASLVDLGLFSNRRFATALAISFLFGFSNFSSVYAFPIFGQIVQSFTPTIAGSMLLPGSLFAAAVLPLTGRVADKVPAPFILAGGHVVIALSIVMLANADANTAFWFVAFALLLGRFGSAFVSPALNTTALGALSMEQMRRGAGVANLSLMLGGSTGISCFVLLLERRIEFHATNLGATQTAAHGPTMDLLGAVSGQLSSAGLPTAAQQGLAMDYLDRMVTAQANMLGFQDGFVAIAVIALIPLIPVAMLWRGRRR